MRLGTRVWSVGKFFLLIGALGATFLLFFVFSMRMAIRAREVEVPVVMGLTVNEATEALAAIGLGLRVDENRRADAKIPPGRVMQQDPGAGMRARRQRTIRVWVSSGPRVTTVPSLIGQSERTAQMRLAQDGVQVGTRSEIRSADYPAEAVVSQNPPPNSRAPEVSLLVNRGEEATTFVMPDLDRHGRRTRRRGDAKPRLSRQHRRDAASPRHACRHHHPAAARWRLQGGGGRFDLARGESMSSTPKAPLVQIAPSILSADFAALGRDISAAERGGADLIHVDVMDGHFVPNITIGPPVVRAIKRIATRPLDVHLMIEEPDRYIEEFIAAGASMVSVHVEAVPHLHRSVTQIKKLGARAGVVLNPSTPAVMLEDIAAEVDFVLVMSVNPGFGGQSFIPNTLKKLQRVRAVLTAAGSSAPIEIDGGVDLSNVAEVVAAGANILVAGQAIFGASDPEAATRTLRAAANRTPGG